MYPGSREAAGGASGLPGSRVYSGAGYSGVPGIPGPRISAAENVSRARVCPFDDPVRPWVGLEGGEVARRLRSRALYVAQLCPGYLKAVWPA